MIKVAIDSGPLESGHKVRGVGVYARELIKKIWRLSSQNKNLRVDAFDFSANQKSLITNHYDLVHYTYFNPFFITLPFNKPAKIVVTIHDTIPLVYPQYYPPGIRGKIRFQIQKYLLKDIDGVIVPSETSRKDVVRFLGITQEKIKVIPEAPRSIFKTITDQKKLNLAKRKYKLPERFVLYVGDVNYNKNILGLIKACKITKLPLVICGKQAKDIEGLDLGLDLMKGPMDWFRYLFDIPHPELAHFRDLVEMFDSKQKIMRLGYVADSDLVKIYNLASVYCQPSFYEGFGLPVLEAFACGLPVVCAKTQALVEIANDAALFADPNKPKELARKIIEIVKSGKTKQGLIKKSHQRVKDFSWRKAARQTVEFYQSV